MAEIKRYYWLKLQDDFFSSKRIKKLRKLAGGDTYTIIYLKMQLKSLKTDGCLEYTGIEDTFAKELALDIDEDEDNVAVTINYLLSVGLLEAKDDVYSMPYVALCTGSETAVAERVRNHRAKQKTLQCNTDVTQVKQLGNVEKEIEKEIEIEKNNTTIADVDFAELRELEKFGEELEAVITLPLKEGNHNVTKEAFDTYKSTFPKVDVLQELKKMKLWLESNPTKAKTKAGINRFITNWLNKEADKEKQIATSTSKKYYDVEDESKNNVDIKTARKELFGE